VGLRRSSGTPQNKNMLYIITHSTPGSQNSPAPVERLVTSLCRVSVRGVAWVRAWGGMCEVW